MATKQDDEPGSPLSPTEKAYGRFVPRQFLQLLGRPSLIDVELGDHVEQEINLLFSDIRDFTSLSESILPAETFRFINSYLSVMEPVVSSHQGFIDKYIGDGIMGLFPGDADNAVRCGIDMLRQLGIYNEGRARAGYIPIRIGIGINTGLVMMGTVGGHNRMDSTVIGDAVNQASRLENLTKVYRTPLLISEHTLHALKDPSLYDIRFVDRIKVRGNYPAQSVFEVFDADPEPLRLAKRETIETFNEALARYHLGRTNEAIPLLEQCLHIAPDDQTARIYLEHCRASQRAGESDTMVPRFDLEWNAGYAVGNVGIDHHHVELLEHMRSLMQAVAAESNAEAPAAAVAEQLGTHFSAEENLMRRYGYAFASEHLRQHQALLASFERMRAQILARERSTARLLFDMQVFLVDWYINHMTKSDRHLSHHLQRAGVG